MEDNDSVLCLACGEEITDELVECDDCGLLMCVPCNEAHDCPEDDM